MPTQPIPHNLPKVTHPLYGRPGELQQAWKLLKKHRLVTFTGPAGVGKTFLALHLAYAHLQSFPGGIFYVQLSTVKQGLNAIARTVGAEDNPQHTLSESICTRLSDGASLLILDGATPAHQLQEFTSSLLEGAPKLHLLVTADDLLYLPGEQILVIPPLALPSPDPHSHPETLPEYLQRIPAVTLFVQLAQEADPTFRLEHEQANCVVALCSLVGGLPLGLQLTAAQCRQMPVAQILAGLQAVQHAAAQASEAQILQRVLEWSAGLLDDSARGLLFDLAIFSGSFSPQAAQTICTAEKASPEEFWHSLKRLLSSALLREEPGAAEAAARCYLPDAVQAYAMEHLLQTVRAESLRERHACFYADLAEKAGEGLRGPDQPKFLGLLETEYANLTAAIHWATQTGRAELALRLTGGLTRFWIIRSYFREGLACLDSALELAHNASDAISAKAFNGAGVMASSLGSYETARMYFHQALARARMVKDLSMTASVLNNLGIIAGDRAEYSQASRFFAEALEIEQQIEDQWGVCNVQMNLGIVENHRGKHHLARQLFEQCLGFARQAGVQNLIALNLHNLGEALINLDELELARGNFEESNRLACELEDQETIANSLGGLGKTALYQGMLDDALSFFEQATAVAASIGHQTGIAGSLHWQGAVYCLQGNQAAAAEKLLESLMRGSALGLRKEVCQVLTCLAKLASLQQAPEHAARMLGAAEHLRQEIELTYGLPEQKQQQCIQEQVRSQLSEAAYQAAWEEGLALTFKQAVALGQQLAGPSKTE